MEREIDIKAVGRVRQPDGNWLIINSNQLSFKSKDPKVDETTYSAAVSLQIKCEDQSEGNYFLYNQNSKLINEGLG
jgi:predicted 3-demethylubiquinone-9 3-methyltransferase (glyoxalase superfamily)